MTRPSMRHRLFAPAALVVLSGGLLQAAAVQAEPAAGGDQSLGYGLRLANPDPLAGTDNNAAPLPGRYDWLGTGISPQHRSQSSFALPGRGALGLSLSEGSIRRSPVSDLRTSHPDASAMRLQAAYLLGDAWGFTSQYEAGAIGDQSPAWTGASSWRESLGVSVFRTGNLLRGDRLSLTLSSPIRTGVGGVVGNASGVSASAQNDAFMGLHPGREYATELSYFTPLSRDAGLGFTLTQRTNILHEYGVTDERMMSIRFSSRF